MAYGDNTMYNNGAAFVAPDAHFDKLFLFNEAMAEKLKVRNSEMLQ
jgi:hypothetical protein